MCMPRQYTLERQDVYTLAMQTLSHLPLKAQGDQVQPTDLLKVLVFAATLRLSGNHACQDLEGAPSAVTVLGQLATQLSDLALLEVTMCEGLARLLPRDLGTKGRRVAVDLIELPYHGSVDDAHEGEVCRGKAKQGTPHFFTYATAYVVLRGRRSTLALCRVQAPMSMDEVLDTLLKRVQALGVTISLLLLDRGFDRVKVIRRLLTGKQPCIMPAIKRGKQPQAPGGPRGIYVMAQWKSSAWTTQTLRSAKDGQATFDMAVVCHNVQGRWGRHHRDTWLYVTWGVMHRPLGWIRQTYRSRFGIASSYRQVHQAKIKTSSRNPVLRLLCVSVACVLRNVWVWLHAEVIAVPRRGARTLQPASLRFARLLLWLVFEVANHYRLLREIPVGRELGKVAQEFGLTFNY